MTAPHNGPSRVDHLDVLLDIGRFAVGADSMAEVYAGVYERVHPVLDPCCLAVSLKAGGAQCRTAFFADDAGPSAVDVTYPALAAAAKPRMLLRDEVPTALPLPHQGMHVMAAPIDTAGTLAGEILTSRARQFGEADLRFLAATATLLGIAMTQARRIDEIDAGRREAERLEEIGRAVASSLELHEVLDRIVDAAIDLTDAEVCTVWQRGPGREARVAASHGSRALPVGATFPVSPALIEQLAQGQRSIYLQDVSTDARLPAQLRALIGEQGPRSAILVPLVAGGEMIGGLSIGHGDVRSYDAPSVRLLERLSFQAAIALENARLHSEIRALSLTDPLTGLPNRRQLDLVLHKEVEAARRGRPLAVILFDLDRFKAFNDTEGHQAGDEALRRFARILANETRAMNIAARYGGDEFVTILSESHLEGATLHARRVSSKVENDAMLGRIGVTAGVAVWEPAMTGPKDLIAAADRDLYRRKEQSSDLLASKPPVA